MISTCDEFNSDSLKSYTCSIRTLTTGIFDFEYLLKVGCSKQCLSFLILDVQSDKDFVKSMTLQQFILSHASNWSVIIPDVAINVSFTSKTFTSWHHQLMAHFTNKQVLVFLLLST